MQHESPEQRTTCQPMPGRMIFRGEEATLHAAAVVEVAIANDAYKKPQVFNAAAVGKTAQADSLVALHGVCNRAVSLYSTVLLVPCQRQGRYIACSFHGLAWPGPTRPTPPRGRRLHSV